MDDQKLVEETNKWLAKLEGEMKNARASEKYKKPAEEIMENIRAYISDCRHFLEKKDFLNAYEAVVYAWGMYEVASRMKIIVKIGKGYGIKT